MDLPARGAPPDPSARPRRSSAAGRRADDEAMLRDFARTRDPLIRDAIVERYMPLARHAAGRFGAGRESMDDLVQVACVGLMKAVNRFDPENGAAFTSYALPTMLGEIRRHFRDRSWAVRPPRDLQEHALLVSRATDELFASGGRSPSVGEIAAATGLGEEDVLEARMALNGRGTTSLTPMDGDGDDGERERASERHLATTEDGFARAEDRRYLGELGRILTPRDREILRLRFEEDLTQAEIGARVGLSQMHVSRLVRDALERLRVEAQRPAATTTI